LLIETYNIVTIKKQQRETAGEDAEEESRGREQRKRAEEESRGEQQRRRAEEESRGREQRRRAEEESRGIYPEFSRRIICRRFSANA
jgi:hypothetical protein